MLGPRGNVLAGATGRAGSTPRERHRRARFRALLRRCAALAIPDPLEFPGLSAHPLFAEPPDEVDVPSGLLDAVPLAERLIELHELCRALDADRKDTGLFYTPAWLATHLVARVAAPLTGEPHDAREAGPESIEDPACGGGAFLVPALRHRLQGVRDADERQALARATMRGTDTDAAAITIAQTSLALVAAEGTRTRDRGLVFPHLRVADPLRETTHGTADWVIGNPPFLDAKSRVRTDAAAGGRLRARFPALAGAFDLFVPFVLRACELVRPGGRLGLIVPDRLLTTTYAESARAALFTRTALRELVDLAALGAFPDAAVFPVFVSARAGLAPAGHRFLRGALAPGLLTTGAERVEQSSLPIDGARLPEEAPPLASTEASPVRATQPLANLFSVHAGTMGFDAALMSNALYDDDDDDAAADAGPEKRASIPFAVTGSVDRYRLTDAPVRFQKRTYRAPRLPLATPLSATRWALYRAPKIVVAGLARRLEATWVQVPLALGIAAYALLPLPSVSPEEVLAQLAVLNSAWLSDLYRARHGHRRLSGGYLTFHRRELAALPLPVLSPAERTELAALATARASSAADAPEHALALDNQIDQIVNRLFSVSTPRDADVR
jgi:hypothetical protein